MTRGTALIALLGFACGQPRPVATRTLDAARHLADQCRFVEAVALVAKAPERERESREGRLMHARLLIQLERGREAYVAVASLAASPRIEEEAERQFALALAASAEGALDTAEAHLTRAAGLGVDRDLIDEASAVVQIQRGALNEAEDLLRDVLERSPALSGALWNLAVVRARRHDRAGATALVKRAWRAGLRDPLALQRDPHLRPLMAGAEFRAERREAARCTGW